MQNFLVDIYKYIHIIENDTSLNYLINLNLYFILEYTNLYYNI